MAFLEVAALAFGIILLAEFGDKTQLVLVSLALRGHVLALFLGAALAFAAVVGVTVVFSDLIARLVPPLLIALAGGLLFIVFGIRTFLERDESEATDVSRDTRQGPKDAFLSSLGLVLFAELGDKTQIGILALAATTGEPVAVAVGGWVALVLLSAGALLLGNLLARVVPVRVVRIGSAIVFVLVGIALLAAGLLDALAAAPGMLMWPEPLGGVDG